jgi:hypothetical protein
MFLLKKTKTLTKIEIKNIINLKKIFWNKYNYKDHHNWFVDNIKSNDLHFIYKIKSKIVIYCCLRLRRIFYKKKVIPFFYLDTLCSNKKYRGKIVFDFLKFLFTKTKNKPIILLCKNYMIQFYKISLTCKKVKNLIFANHDASKYNTLIYVPDDHKYKKILFTKKIKILL